MQKSVDKPNQPAQQHSQNYQSDDQEDDLFMFQQLQRMKIIKQNNLAIGFQQDEDDSKYFNKNKQKEFSSDQEKEQSFNKFYGNKKSQIERDINKNKKDKNSASQQINQQDLSAKKLRAFNASKYFQKIKLTFLKQIYNLSRQFNQLSDQSTSKYLLQQVQFNKFLSLLPYQTLIKCIRIKDKNPLTINKNQVLNIFRQTFTNQILQQIVHNKLLTKNQLLLKFAVYLNCKIKKINFFSIQSFVDQSFYNLDYEKNNNKKVKKSKKTSTKLEDIIKNKITRQVYEQQIQSKEQYVDFDTFSFDSVVKTMSKSQNQIEQDLKVTKKRSKKIQQMKKYFMQQTYQIYSFTENKWKYFMSIDEHFQQVQVQWLKQNVLNGMPIVAIFSSQNLIPLKQFKPLFQLRQMRTFVLKDLSMIFCDNWRKLVARKKRVGIRILINKIFRLCNFKKPYDILEPYDSFQYQSTVNYLKKTLIQTQLPKTNIQFSFNDYFITPSRVGKYHILSPQSKPIENTEEFNEEKMYWKDDLIPVCSRMGWIDFSRMVVQGSQPLKRTQNRNKKAIQLFRYEQTKPFQLQLDHQGNFVLDPQHNSIYVPPKLTLPPSTCIVKQKISFICNKHKFRHAKLVQGFTHTGGMRVLPNEIGFIIYQRDKQQILRLYGQRLQMLNKNKETKYDQKMEKMWKQVLKYVKLIDRMGGEMAAR